MSLRDLASGPSCAPDSSPNPLSKAADYLFPQSSRSKVSQAASSSTHAEQALLRNANLREEDLPRVLAQQLARQNVPVSQFAPPLPTGATAQFEAAFRDVAHPFAGLPPVAPPPPVLPPPHPIMMHPRPFVAEFIARQEADKLATEFQRTSLHHNSSQYVVPRRMNMYAGPMHSMERVTRLTESVNQHVKERVLREERWDDMRETPKEKEDAEEAKSWGDEFTSLEGGLQEDFFVWDDEDRYGAAVEMMMNASGMEETDLLEGRYELGAQRQNGRHGREALELAEKLRTEGRLREAIELLEEALGKEDDLEKEEILKGWYLLGLSLMESDDDVAAVKALREGKARGGGAVFLEGLAVCYTNEMRGGEAVGCIREWFENRGGVGELEEGLEEMRDVEACVMLGVLYNLRREYEQAARVLKKAVSMREDESGLWNKLGATLANGGKGDEALRAYRRAVDLSPGMVRAWVNVGTAYVNGGNVGKGVRYYVKALGMTEGDHVGHVWGYLRTGVLSLGRTDLMDAVERRDLEALRMGLGV